MLALMGSLGACKTTVMGVLFQIQGNSCIEGSVMINGKTQRLISQRQPGTVNRMIPTNLLRLYLGSGFSAYLRQPVKVSNAYGDAYIERSIELLGLGFLMHAITDPPG
jgi:ABC-type multidrug transport system ATPase subunit